ncbi:hypothetical protein LJN58_13390 [Salmonella enterica subsp. enterica serovar Saintpaul]|nr:hypothetical protein [Salmonella enterica subsp. enterica serovar Saintpaul]UDU69527.1 hypothetical protein LJN58_13390 [Salmonella enterica subsp. enterica serovar Saintpaul]
MVVVGTVQRPSTRTRPPAARRRCKSVFLVCASANSFVYFSSRAATSRWRFVMSVIVSFASFRL